VAPDKIAELGVAFGGAVAAATPPPQKIKAGDRLELLCKGPLKARLFLHVHEGGGDRGEDARGSFSW
jgi:hypothetical protein